MPERKEVRKMKKKEEKSLFCSEDIRIARRKSRQAKYLSVTALALSIIALIIRILAVL